ncbi:MAG: signal recognition particle protein [Cyclobacteriaceae bacterium]|nr:signal recognition particle protein [Cyclobacteriaceae bacterium]
MFESLSHKIDKAIQTLKGQGRITEINVAGTIKEIRKALIDADVNYKVAKEVTDEIKAKAMGQNVLTSISPGQLLTKITNDELTQLMGGTSEDIRIEGNPAIILIAGLQGSGKTTFSGKLANYLKRQGRQVLLAACDVYRPAAIDQLTVLAAQVGVDIYTDKETKDPLKIAKAALEHARQNNHRVVIVDTAGRLAVDEEMMQEIASLKDTLKPSETLFVVDAMTGQDAVNTAKAFNDRINFDGVVLSKMDGDTRGGAALSIRRITEKPIKFISSGEKMEALDRFYPDRMAGRILGMGDVVGLVEKAQEAFDQEEADRLQKKIRKNQFDLNDFLNQLAQIKKMGNMKDLLGMIPGVGKAMKDVNVDDNAFKPLEAIIQSMTIKERENPEIINSSRKERIAKGSGTSVQQVNQLLKQFTELRKMMKTMNKMGGGKRALSALNPFGGR